MIETRRIRVLKIISGFAVDGPSGGLARFGIELSRAIDPGRVEMIVCGLWDHDTPSERAWLQYLSGSGVRAFTAAQWHENRPYQSFRRAVGLLNQILADVRPDILHSHCQFGDILTLLLKLRLRLPIVMRTVHNEREWARRPLRRLFLTNGLYPVLFDREVGVSQQVVDNLNRRPVARILNRQAVRIYNALNIDRFAQVRDQRERKRRELGIPEGSIVIGSIGRLSEQKGYGFLIEAARCVVDKRPDVWFVLVGEGPMREALQRRVEDLGLAGRFIMTGARRDVEELLSTFDLFVSSSLWEGLPTVILESMAAGVPVLATDVSGSRELIQHDITGFLVPPGDSHALTGKLVSIINGNERKMEQIIQSARDYVSNNFSINESAYQYVNLYTQLIGGD